MLKESQVVEHHRLRRKDHFFPPPRLPGIWKHRRFESYKRPFRLHPRSL